MRAFFEFLCSTKNYAGWFGKFFRTLQSDYYRKWEDIASNGLKRYSDFFGILWVDLARFSGPWKVIFYRKWDDLASKRLGTYSRDENNFYFGCGACSAHPFNPFRCIPTRRDAQILVNWTVGCSSRHFFSSKLAILLESPPHTHCNSKRGVLSGGSHRTPYRRNTVFRKNLKPTALALRPHGRLRWGTCTEAQGLWSLGKHASLRGKFLKSIPKYWEFSTNTQRKSVK